MSRSSLQREGKRGGLSFLASKIDEKHRMKEAIGNHRTGLPPSLLHLFRGRPAPQRLEPLRKKKPTLPLTGVAAYTEHFEDEPKPPAAEDQKDEPTPMAPDGDEEAAAGDAAAAPVPSIEEEHKIFLNPEYALQVRLDKPTRLERLVKAKKESAQQHKQALEAAIAAYAPSEDPNIEGDPLKTLFVARLADEVSERKLRREFEEFGPIKRIQIIHDKKTDKPRGYAFIEYEHKSDMKEAYKSTDGMRIEGKRVLVDVERGRTVPGWLPRRLGGGKGESRAAQLPKDPVKRTISVLVNKLAGVDDDSAPDGGGGAAGGIAPMDEDRDRIRDKSRDRDGGGGGRYRERERESSRRDRGDRDSRRRDRGGRDRERERDRDDYHRGGERESRKRDRGSGYDDYTRGYEDAGVGQYGGGSGVGRDYGGEVYNTVPPPGTAMPLMYPPPMGGAEIDDEPEEGEFVEVEVEAEEGERDAKRPRGDDE